MELLNASLIDWSRAQFAMTAMYHWLFVPLTLGLGVIMAIMETMYVRTGNEQWKKTAKFWMVLFGINFAIDVLHFLFPVIGYNVTVRIIISEQMFDKCSRTFSCSVLRHIDIQPRLSLVLFARIGWEFAYFPYSICNY